MKKLIAISLSVLAGSFLTLALLGLPIVVRAGNGQLATQNGDVNGDGDLDIADGIYIINYQFRGGPPPVPLDCPPAIKDLPETGQTNCYDENGLEIPCDGAACPGQDGFYATGPANDRFVDKSDGTVSDTSTGLMWQKDTSDTNGDGRVDDDDLLSWCQALAYCENLSLAGNDDWRLPNVRQLQSIVDYGRNRPPIDSVFNAVPGGRYWSSSTNSLFTDNAWTITFHDGTVEGRPGAKDNHLFLRAVRKAH